jgi:hypothetical protein
MEKFIVPICIFSAFVLYFTQYIILLSYRSSWALYLFMYWMVLIIVEECACPPLYWPLSDFVTLFDEAPLPQQNNYPS